MLTVDDQLTYIKADKKKDRLDFEPTNRRFLLIQTWEQKLPSKLINEWFIKTCILLSWKSILQPIMRLHPITNLPKP